MNGAIYLLDTNIISEAIKPVPNKMVMETLNEKISFCKIPALCWHELLFGMSRLEDGKKKNIIQEYLFDFVQKNFPIISYDNHAAWIHADIRARLEKEGVAAPLVDSQIASIAVANNMILVTRNLKDFTPMQKVTPLLLENWFGE